MNKADLLRQAKPILFNTQMVEAILEGRKTQTRRIVKNSHTFGNFEGLTNNMYLTATDKDGEIYPKPVAGLWATFDDDSGVEMYSSRKAPYEPGDILYVRETWCPVISVKNGKYEHIYGYRAGGTKSVNNGLIDIPITGWHPSIHMPKKAARIFLKVTDVKVERLQNITVEGFKQEGIADKCYGCRHRHDICGAAVTSTQDCAYSAIAELVCKFWELWDSTIKKADRDKYGWEANPYVWVNKFERLEVEQ